MTRPVATAAEKEFHEKMHAAHMYGLWELASQMTKHPEPKAIPYMWKASLIETFPRRIDLISLPCSASPASTDSSFSYSNRARRLSNDGSRAALTFSAAAAALRNVLLFMFKGAPLRAARPPRCAWGPRPDLATT